MSDECRPRKTLYRHVRYGEYFKIKDTPFLKSSDDVNFRNYADSQWRTFTRPRAVRLTDGVFSGIDADERVEVICREDAVVIAKRRRHE